MTGRRLLAMIPAKDEATTIAGVVEDAAATFDCDVVVVDDGSSDLTGDVAVNAGATVLRLPYNLGVGGAIRTALRYAARHGYDTVVQLDGDGQHLAPEALPLLDAVWNGTCDLAIGSRFARGYSVHGLRRVMMRMLSALVSRRLGVRITDTTSGFRVMNRRAIELFAVEYPVDYLSDTVEALLLAHDRGLRVQEIDVHMRARQGGAPSASTARTLYHLVRLSLTLVLYSLRRRSPVEATHEPPQKEDS